MDVGRLLGILVGVSLGELLGILLGILVGRSLGESLGILLGILVGRSLGELLGILLGILVGRSLGDALGESDGGEQDPNVVDSKDEKLPPSSLMVTPLYSKVYEPSP